MEFDEKDLKWNYGEMLKALIALSLPAQRQIDSYGEGGVGEEMALEFNQTYNDYVEGYIETGMMTEDEADKLDELIQFFADRNSEEYTAFWTYPEELFTHPEWEELRKLAHECLVKLGKDHLDLDVTIESSTSIDEEGEEVLMQMIYTEIIEKNPEGGEEA